MVGGPGTQADRGGADSLTKVQICEPAPALRACGFLKTRLYAGNPLNALKEPYAR